MTLLFVAIVLKGFGSKKLLLSLLRWRCFTEDYRCYLEFVLTVLVECWCHDVSLLKRDVAVLSAGRYVAHVLCVLKSLVRTRAADGSE